MLANYFPVFDDDYMNQPIDILARLTQNQDLVKLIDDNIRSISAALLLQYKVNFGDIIQLEGKRYQVIYRNDSTGIKWLYLEQLH